MSTAWEGESTETGTDVGDDRDVPESGILEGDLEEADLGVDVDELDDHDI